MRLSKIILLIWDMDIKLTKKEKAFLIDWLNDDLDISKDTSMSHGYSEPTIKNIKSIIKKLTKEQ